MKDYVYRCLDCHAHVETPEEPIFVSDTCIACGSDNIKWIVYGGVKGYHKKKKELLK